MEMLNKKKFKCKDCKLPVTYEKLEPLLHDCSLESNPLFCAICNSATWKGRKDLMNHLEHACPGVKMTCTICELDFKRSEQNSHNCIQALKKALKETK